MNSSDAASSLIDATLPFISEITVDSEKIIIDSDNFDPDGINFILFSLNDKNNQIKSADIDITAVSGNVEININGNDDLKSGENLVYVTAEYPGFEQTFCLIIYKSAVPENINIISEKFNKAMDLYWFSLFDLKDEFIEAENKNPFYLCDNYLDVLNEYLSDNAKSRFEEAYKDSIILKDNK